VIHERYRGDPVASIASYQAALLANPDDTGAREALERLQRSYENLLARAKKAKK
jgi:CTP:molybdopterin cytidylyltransferase MocA